jgi:hypothetical protein
MQSTLPRRANGEQLIPPPPPPEAPARTPDRQRLADAIDAHRGATEAHSRGVQAIEALRDELYEKLRPELGACKERLEDARAGEPFRLTQRLLDSEPDESGGADPVADAERALDKAQQAVDRAHEGRQLLEIELGERDRQLNMARHNLDTAVAHAISTDPLKDQLVSEFFRVGKHLLRLAQIAKTLGIRLSGVDNEDVGLNLRLNVITRPGSQGEVDDFKPDIAFSEAMERPAH